MVALNTADEISTSVIFEAHRNPIINISQLLHYLFLALFEDVTSTLLIVVILYVSFSWVVRVQFNSINQ